MVKQPPWPALPARAAKHFGLRFDHAAKLAQQGGPAFQAHQQVVFGDLKSVTQLARRDGLQTSRVGLARLRGFAGKEAGGEGVEAGDAQTFGA